MKFFSCDTIIICFFSSIICFSCNSTDSNTEEVNVYYYPEKNIYYDSRQSNYYYSLDGGRSWDSMQYKGSEYGAALGQKVALPGAGKNFWENNVAHRQQYSGVLLNIINNQTIEMFKADSIRRSKPAVLVKPRKVGDKITKEPPKKGLKKFFNKIFGSKKKPAKEKK